jgi:hypothetical protein
MHFVNSPQAAAARGSTVRGFRDQPALIRVGRRGFGALGFLIAFGTGLVGRLAAQGQGGAEPVIDRQFRVEATATITLLREGNELKRDLALEGSLALRIAMTPEAVRGDGQGGFFPGHGAVGIGACFLDIKTMYTRILEVDLKARDAELGGVTFSQSARESLGVVQNVRDFQPDNFPTSFCVGDVTHHLFLDILAERGSPNGPLGFHHSEALVVSGTQVPTVDALISYSLANPNGPAVALQDQNQKEVGSLSGLVLNIQRAEAGEGLLGDCNSDGSLDISDAVCVFGVLFVGSPPEFPCGHSLYSLGNRILLDWQQDIHIDISDGIAILQFLFLNGPPHRLASRGSCPILLACPEVRVCR